jgi:dimethylhistidine N-methyltransferase
MREERVGALRLIDYKPKQDFAADVAAGLSSTPRYIPSKYLYDAEGSHLFERICELPEYYLTRTELAIMREHIDAMCELLGPRCAVVEPGSGSGLKTRMLLSHLPDPVAYIPVDISRELLIATATALATDFPAAEIVPVCADYLSDWELPQLSRAAERNVVFFPGSTIGNMEPDEAQRFLQRMCQVCGPDCGMLVGVDLRKDPEVIAAAYDDRAGVTRAFNLNLVARMNRELHLNLNPDSVSHVTYYNAEAGRNESYLLPLEPLSFDIGSRHFDIAAGERILVEHSYKYSLGQFAQLSAEAGLRVDRVWTDAAQWFSVQYLVPAT